ncbi:MAG: hypothetical protein HYY18_13040 [Planctomycetes bacterium]|nr:hypothetical protein [Planctomycetota bacterium]
MTGPNDSTDPRFNVLSCSLIPQESSPSAGLRPVSERLQPYFAVLAAIRGAAISSRSRACTEEVGQALWLQ